MTSLVTVLFFIIIALALLIAIRELVCWYFRITDILQILRSIDTSLKRISGISSRSVPNSRINTDRLESLNQKDTSEISLKVKIFFFFWIIVLLAAITLLYIYYR